jgi:hypothetical protein
VQIKLSALWVAAMFGWVYGDLLRIYSGDFIAGEVIGEDVMSPQTFWMIGAITMIIPGVMVFLSLVLKYKANRWANIIAAIFFFVLSLVGLPGYPGAYDKFLIIVGLVFNVITVWYAWKWV